MANVYYFNDDSDDDIHVFVNKDAPHRLQGKGLENDSDVNNNEQFCKKIFVTESYNHTHSSVAEFYSDVYYVMNNNKLDRKTVYDLFVKDAKVGCLGGNVSSLYSDIKVKRRVTQEDIYIWKLKGFIKLARHLEFHSRYDANNLRLFIEMVLEESIAALNISVFNRQKSIHNYLKELRKIMMLPCYLDAMWLSYKLFRLSFKVQDMHIEENLGHAAKRINCVFIPYIKLLESDRKFLSKQKKIDNNLDAFLKIKHILSKENIKNISRENPVHLVTSEMSGKIKIFMDTEVDPKQQMMRAITVTHPCATQNSEATSPTNATQTQTGLLALKEVPAAHESSPNNHEHHRTFNFKIPLPSMTHSHSEHPQYEDLKDSDTNSIPTQTHQKTVQFKLSNMESIDKQSIISNISNPSHFYGPTPKMVEVNKKEIDDKDVELSFVDENQLELRIERGYSSEGNFSQALRSATTRARGPSKYKPLHKGSDGNSALTVSSGDGGKSPIKKLQKMVNMIAAAGNMTPKNSTSQLRRIPTSRAKDKKNTPVLFGPNELTDDSPLTSVIQKNEKLSKEPEQAQQEIPAAPKIDEAFNRVTEIGNDYTSKWERVSNNALITIDKIMPEGSPVVLIRAWAFIEGYSPEEVFQQIFDTEKRAKWETVTMGLSVVEKFNENSQIMYFYVKTPIGISERDFVQRRNYLKDYPKQGEITMTFKSVVHEKAPPLKNRIRAETHISGYIMRPSTKAPNSTDFCIISQSDIKGSIPKWMVNQASQRAPTEWIKKLIQACEKSRKEGK